VDRSRTQRVGHQRRQAGSPAGWCRANAGALALLLGSAFLLACGPVGPCAGGALSGEVGPSQIQDWSFAAEIATAQLETRPDEPHSVNTWFVGIGASLYVPTSMIRGPRTPTERSWVSHVSIDPRVRIRLGEPVFERVAVRVTDESEYERARAALEAKYDLDVADRDPERTIWIYRLEPRTPSRARSEPTPAPIPTPISTPIPKQRAAYRSAFSASAASTNEVVGRMKMPSASAHSVAPSCIVPWMKALRPSRRSSQLRIRIG